MPALSDIVWRILSVKPNSSIAVVSECFLGLGWLPGESSDPYGRFLLGTLSAVTYFGEDGCTVDFRIKDLGLLPEVLWDAGREEWYLGVRSDVDDIAVELAPVFSGLEAEEIPFHPSGDLLNLEEARYWMSGFWVCSLGVSHPDIEWPMSIDLRLESVAMSKT